MILSIDIWVFVVWALNIIVVPLIIATLFITSFGFSSFIKMLRLIVLPERIRNNIPTSSNALEYVHKKIGVLSWIWFSILAICAIFSSVVFFAFGLIKMYDNVPNIVFHIFLFVSNFALILTIVFFVIQIVIFKEVKSLKKICNKDSQSIQTPNFEHLDTNESISLPSFVKVNLNGYSNYRILLWSTKFIALFFKLFKKDNEFKKCFLYLLSILDFSLIDANNIDNQVWKAYLARFK